MPEGGPKPVEPAILPDFPEVRVRARRRQSGPSLFLENLLRGWNVITSSDPPPGGVVAFVSPAAPKVVEEIVVTAQRRPPPVDLRTAGSLRGLGYAGLAVGAIFTLDWFARKAREEELATRAKYLQDQRLREMAEEMSSTVTVVEKRIPQVDPWAPVDLPAPLMLPPMPQFQKPDPDFEVLRPIIVTPQPSAQPLPGVEIAPVTAPTIRPATSPAVLPELLPIPAPQPLLVPGTLPTTAPAIRTSPSTRPSIRPETQPAVSPATQPATQQATALSSSTRVRQQQETALRRLTETKPEVLAFGDLEARQDNCPPCKEDPEKPRTKCYKKLVFEHQMPELDETFEWAEIDCLTQQEL